MYCELSLEVTKFEEYDNRNQQYGTGGCEVHQTLKVQGSWEFDGHPNIDAYAFDAYGYGHFDILLGNIGFNPEYYFEPDYDTVGVSFTGTDEEWLEQAKVFHDGQYADDPREALEILSGFEEFKLEEDRIGQILEKDTAKV